MKIPKSKRNKEEDEIDTTPGPGTYILSKDWREMKFAHTKGNRTCHKFNQNPGPGQYNLDKSIYVTKPHKYRSVKKTETVSSIKK